MWEGKGSSTHDTMWAMDPIFKVVRRRLLSGAALRFKELGYNTV